VKPIVQPESPAWLASCLGWLNMAWLNTAWLTSRRLHAQAILLALCLWGVCAVDFSTPGLFDRAGNIKFQDFLPFYVSGRLIAHDRAPDLYHPQVVLQEIQSIVQRPTRLLLPYLYGPQLGLLFAPFSRFSFPAAAWIWVLANLVAFFACIYLLWRSCPQLRMHGRIVAIAALAFPPLFHFLVRGQISVLILACFTAASLAFRADRYALAGIALGVLVFKPQFLVAIPLVFLLSRSWKILAGLIASAAAQLAFAWIYFGSAVLRAYFEALWPVSRWIGTAELNLAPTQMHSLRSFWTLLIPWPLAALILYVLTSLVVVAIAAAIWKSSSPPAFRFSALTLAAVLVNPHLFVYDLLVLAPVLLLLVNWILSNPQRHFSAALQLLAYLAFVLPLFGPLSRWTHVQQSVLIFVALLWVLWRHRADFASPDAGPRLASHEARVV
jgi:glycosyl transferase family 87